MTSVNVEGRGADEERKALLELALKLDDNLSLRGKRCMICGGHGAVSVLAGNKLATYGSVERYRAN